MHWCMFVHACCYRYAFYYHIGYSYIICLLLILCIDPFPDRYICKFYLLRLKLHGQMQKQTP